MRLINTETLQLEEFYNNIPPYAILSHVWGKEEVSLSDWADLESARQKEGYRKIDLACTQAKNDGLEYAWVDTNCIDKSSSSELSEAINSMYAWYQNAAVCYVYLQDVSTKSTQDFTDRRCANENIAADSAKSTFDSLLRASFVVSRWFTRGWTLQELLAPKRVLFYSYEWTYIAAKLSDAGLISNITCIHPRYISGASIEQASVAERMSWMSRRTTTRIEDSAYCLLGIFGINMALLYGEGSRAFLRLQEEIIRISNDQTIFCWSLFTQHSGYVYQNEEERALVEGWNNILAPYPAAFWTSAGYQPMTSDGPSGLSEEQVAPYTITNLGLEISLPLMNFEYAGCRCVVLDVVAPGNTGWGVFVNVFLTQSGNYCRAADRMLVMPLSRLSLGPRERIHIKCRGGPSSIAGSELTISRLAHRHLYRITSSSHYGSGDTFVFFMFDQRVKIGKRRLGGLSNDAFYASYIPVYRLQYDSMRLALSGVAIPQTAGQDVGAYVPIELICDLKVPSNPTAQLSIDVMGRTRDTSRREVPLYARLCRFLTGSYVCYIRLGDLASADQP